MTIVLGLALQVASLAVVFLAYGARAFRRPGLYLLLSALVYHGVTEVGQTVGSPSEVRSVTTPDSVAKWTTVVGISMLAFAIAYVGLVGRSNVRAEVPAMSHEVRTRLLRAFDWRVFAIPSLVLVVLTARAGAPTPGVQNSGGFAGQFLIPIISLATINFVASRRSRIVPAVVVELLLVTVAGSRLGVVTTGVVTLFGLMLLGVRPTKREAVICLLAVGVLGVTVSAARNQVSREAITAASSPLARLQIIASGAWGALKGDEAPDLTASEPFASRIDGNTFPAAIMDALQSGRDGTGLTTLANDVQLAIPSFLYPSKLGTSLQDRSEKEYIDNYYGLGISTDFLPTQFGIMVSYYGPFWLPMLAVLLASIFAIGDRMMIRPTFAGFLTPLWLVQCALTYERGMDVYFLTARGFVVILAGMLVFDLVLPSRRVDRSITVENTST